MQHNLPIDDRRIRDISCASELDCVHRPRQHRLIEARAKATSKDERRTDSSRRKARYVTIKGKQERGRALAV